MEPYAGIKGRFDTLARGKIVTEEGAPWGRSVPPSNGLLAVCASLILALVLDQVAVPASFLVGPMLIGIFCALAGATIRLPRSAFIAGQALIGCLIARSIQRLF